MNVPKFSLFLCLLLIPCVLLAQKDPAWDNTQDKNWPPEAQKVSIKSSRDDKPQAAYFYAAPGSTPKPLIVSLHTWSGDYRQKDTLIHFCIRQGFNYIHPDFRGPNHHPDALGSDLVVSDIDDAIDFALANSRTDPDNIHVMGVSGGGHAAVLTYMRSRHTIRSFSAYVGIYNLIDWYHESLGRGNKYAGDIAISTSGDKNKIDLEAAKHRSPILWPTPVGSRKNSTLNLYCGIHDGYTGSVPITQTLRLYNKVVRDFKPDAGAELIPDEYIETMVKTRALPGFPAYGSFHGRKIIYANKLDTRVRLTVFEGTHEMPPGDVLDHVPSGTILAIGDSNGAAEDGWVNQLQNLRPQDRIVNTCISGNTIAFDNNGSENLNTLKNLSKYIGRVNSRLNYIVILLGTNDCKAVFDQELPKVPENLNQLLTRIREELSKKPVLGNPEIVVVSPPPYGRDEVMESKYHGAARRVEYLAKQFERIAKIQKARYVNTYEKLLPVFPYISRDGVHLTKEGQVLLASMINESINQTGN